MRIRDFEIFQFKFCFVTTFTDEFRSFVDCSLLVSFGDCKFFFQTHMALLHPAVARNRLADDIGNPTFGRGGIWAQCHLGAEAFGRSAIWAQSHLGAKYVRIYFALVF